ncbi:hypothetical protein V5J35_001322 [Endozoicomonas sp. NE40]|uniref:Uncharacterized protein n=1 Tax=Endozoicomonas lisbonensis TaxID=3120522 RepID=A0ABV2SED5_9GAMM
MIRTKARATALVGIASVIEDGCIVVIRGLF